MFESEINNFIQKVEALSKQLFPNSVFRINYIRINRVGFRIELQEEEFVDIYFNAENGRKSYALIKDQKRIIGWDNLGGWHRHPFENPDKHIKCREPKVKKVFMQIKKLRESSG